MEKGLFGMKFMQRGEEKQVAAARKLEAGEDDYETAEKKKRKEQDGAPTGKRSFAGPKEGQAADEPQAKSRVKLVDGTHQVQRVASEGGRLTKTKGPIYLDGDAQGHAEAELEAGGDDDVDVHTDEKKRAQAASRQGAAETEEQQAAKRKWKEKKAKAASEPLDKGAPYFVAISIPCTHSRN